MSKQITTLPLYDEEDAYCACESVIKTEKSQYRRRFKTEHLQDPILTQNDQTTETKEEKNARSTKKDGEELERKEKEL